MANRTLKQLKIAAFFEARLYESFHRNAEYFGYAIDGFGGTFLKLRSAAANVVDCCIGNTAVFSQAVLRYVFIVHQIVYSQGNFPPLHIIISVNRYIVNRVSVNSLLESEPLW
jgi:hypothetical protein